MVSANREQNGALAAIWDRRTVLAFFERRIEGVIDRKALGRAGLVLAPRVLAAAV
jgi:hypothetical protein